MKSLSLFLLLLLPSLGVGQERLTLSARPTTEAVQSAKELIKSAETTPTKLAVGGYALIDIKMPGKLTVYIVPGSDDCIAKIPLPKGVPYEGWLAGNDGSFSFRRVDPTADDRVLVTGLKAGQATLIWMTVKDDTAVVVAAFQFQVGQPKPPPPKPDDPPPVDDPLVKAFKTALAQDVAAGKADRKYLLPLAGIYEAASKNIPATVTTIGQLDDALVNARKAAGIPEPEETLLNLRRAVQLEIYSRLGVNKDSGNVQLTADTRRLAMVAFGKISEALEAISQ